VAPMRVGIILDWMNPNIEQAVRVLSERGVKVALIHPEKQFISLARVQVENDLYVLKSGFRRARLLGRPHTRWLAMRPILLLREPTVERLE